MTEPVIDIRGEPCGAPALRVERFIQANPGVASFVVLGDHPGTMETLRVLGERHGLEVELSVDPSGDWRARFERRGAAAS